MNKLEFNILLMQKGWTKRRLAKALGLSETGLGNKINGKFDWKRSEMLKLCELLEVPMAEIAEIFFN